MRTDPGALARVRAVRACACVLLLLAAGCARERAEAPPARAVALAVTVLADTGRAPSVSARVPPEARVWLASVTPARAPAPSPEVPAPEPDSLPPGGDEGPALQVDPGLKPPVLRTPGSLLLPRGHAGGRVELDVHVDETGAVDEVAWATGSADTALVGAARRCAQGMRFYPALRGGRPVAVWCRQRFDLKGGTP